MVSNSFLRAASGIGIVGAVLAISGCAALAPATPEQAVTQRAQAYWQSRIAGKVEESYALSSPSYRKVRTLDQFKKQFGTGVSIEGAEVTKVSCEAEKCIAAMKISANPALLRMNVGTIATYVNETWVLEDGQWWRYQEL